MHTQGGGDGVGRDGAWGMGDCQAARGQGPPKKLIFMVGVVEVRAAQMQGGDGRGGLIAKLPGASLLAPAVCRNWGASRVQPAGGGGMGGGRSGYRMWWHLNMHAQESLPIHVHKLLVMSPLCSTCGTRT